LLKRYGLRPKVIRINGKTPSGYTRKSFEDLWERYLPAYDSALAPNLDSEEFPF
jgi:hypothetical protein